MRTLKPDAAHPTTRRVRTATVLATATLILTPLICTQTPAFADGEEWFDEDGSNKKMTEVAPLNPTESVLGYPVVGLDLKEIQRADVEKKYPHEKALEDAQGKLGIKFQPDVPIKENPDIRNTTSDDTEPWLSQLDGTAKVTAQTDCGKSEATAPPSCGFVGALDEAHPSATVSAQVTGDADFEFKTQTTVAREEGKTSGWSIGGKVSGKGSAEGTPGGEGAPEFNFSYTESTTTVNKWQQLTEGTVKMKIPKGKTGWVDGRMNGGWYIGYIVHLVNVVDQGGKNPRQKMTLIPARVMIQSPSTKSPMTWIKRAL
ncbi:hypothetical protein [Streptomyces sp. NPDC048637]|uniref:hypothetical protein n=1 Tax=Streptomyces sp. NPDC048637 TaxID=3155636 RepID=UPI00342C4D06